jgi:hypothetical protein
MYKAFTPEYLKAQLELAVRFNLLKATKKKPICVDIETANSIFPNSFFVKSYVKKGAVSFDVYWTGKQLLYARPKH